MPAMLDDPTSPPVLRPQDVLATTTPTLPLQIRPLLLTLRDSSKATLLPFRASPGQVPSELLSTLSSLFNAEILAGDTYPMLETVALERFGPYWFGNFAAVMLAGDWTGATLADHVASRYEAVDWPAVLLGTFYIKPNYPGRSSHVCNAGFLVAPPARGKGVGRAMGEVYVDWAPRLGYEYSVFNLVYETNVASLRIWDALGFERIGRVKGCGKLRSWPDRKVDAIVFGRELKVRDG